MNEFNPKNYVSAEAAWLAYRRLWLKEHPPLDNGHYLCSIGGEWVKADEVTLDHVEPRSADNMFKESNIAPACGYHNYRKGSKRWKPKVSKEQHDFLRMLSDMGS